MLINDIKKANMLALKNKDEDARASLSIVISRYQGLLTSGKGEPTDADLLRIIQKVAKELDEEKEGYLKAGRADSAAKIDRQKEAIVAFLPKMLTPEEIKAIIASLEDKSIPAVMKHFKANYDGQCDMGLVSKLAREA
ncbi:MAG: GatB/YqeY domain-containing protein [Bacillota bacterium]|nr:GatB/YqeY domain-containing protein [Bacillota bacterium]